MEFPVCRMPSRYTKSGQMITSALMNSLYGLPHLYHLFICNEINLLKDSVSCKNILFIDDDKQQLLFALFPTAINTLLPRPLHLRECQTSVSSDPRSQCGASVHSPTVQHVQPLLQEGSSVPLLAEVRQELP